MTGHAYRTSARIAQVTGPFAGFSKNREPMLRVMGKHRAAVDEIDAPLVQTDLFEAARTAWDEAIALGQEHGYRNAQASVLAPTGTIGLLMDCDTTGIEPDLALVKTKKLVGGGSMSIVNQTVPRALRTLGYADEHVQAIAEYVAENNSVQGAPALRAEHYDVFDCAMGDTPIHYMGHMKMMAAVQPFLAGRSPSASWVTRCSPLAKVSFASAACTTARPPTPSAMRYWRWHRMGGSPEDRVPSTTAASARSARAKLRCGHRVTGTPNHRLLVLASEAGVERGDRSMSSKPGDHRSRCSTAPRFGRRSTGPPSTTSSRRAAPTDARRTSKSRRR